MLVALFPAPNQNEKRLDENLKSVFRDRSVNLKSTRYEAYFVCELHGTIVAAISSESSRGNSVMIPI